MTPVDGGPAFPHEIYHQVDRMGSQRINRFQGMSLRDYFAAKALPEVIHLFTTGSLELKAGGKITEAHVAEQAYAFADAMLAARAQTDQH